MKKLSFAICICLLLSASCSQPKPEARRYGVTGQVISVDKRGHMLILKHQEIVGYMSAMTMGFVVKDDWVLNVTKPGDRVQATLVVEGMHSWLEGVVVTEAAKPDASYAGLPPVHPPEPGEAMPDFALVNQDGKKIIKRDFRGKLLLLTFIYTRCPLPDYCPLMSKNFAAIAREVAADPKLRDSVHLLSISIDPEYDKPAVLRQYAREYTGEKPGFDRWQFASGTPEEVRKIAEFFGLNYWKESDQIIHALVTALIDPQGKVSKVYRGNEWKPADVLADARPLAGS